MPAYGLNRVVALAAVLLITAPVHAQPGGGAENVVLAVPNVALTFAPGYLAEDLGLFAKHGLNLKSVVITGIGSANAVISGSADFAQISGATLTRAAAAISLRRTIWMTGRLSVPTTASSRWPRAAARVSVAPEICAKSALPEITA